MLCTIDTLLDIMFLVGSLFCHWTSSLLREKQLYPIPHMITPHHRHMICRVLDMYHLHTGTYPAQSISSLVRRTPPFTRSFQDPDAGVSRIRLLLSAYLILQSFIRMPTFLARVILGSFTRFGILLSRTVSLRL